MTEWILSSSVLIAILILLRRCLRGKMKPQLQYGLWLLVLVRLLMPFSLGESAMSVEQILPVSVAPPQVHQYSPS